MLQELLILINLMSKQPIVLWLLFMFSSHSYPLESMGRSEEDSWCPCYYYIASLYNMLHYMPTINKLDYLHSQAASYAPLDFYIILRSGAICCGFFFIRHWCKEYKRELGLDKQCDMELHLHTALCKQIYDVTGLRAQSTFLFFKAHMTLLLQMATKWHTANFVTMAPETLNQR